MALPKLEGRITFASAQDIAVVDGGGGGTATVAAGNYYLTSASDAGFSLLAALKTALEALPGAVTYTITLDDTSDTSTGKITITPNAGTVALTWSSTPIRDALGFSGNVAATASAVGDYQARFLWLPNVGRVGVMSPEPSSTSYDMGAEEVDGTFTFSPSGASKRLAYSRRFIDTLAFDQVLGSKTWIAHEVTINESFQRFFRDVVSEGYPVRFHPDRSSDTVYWTWVVANFDAFRPQPLMLGWVGPMSLWALGYEVRKLV